MLLTSIAELTLSLVKVYVYVYTFIQKFYISFWHYAFSFCEQHVGMNK